VAARAGPGARLGHLIRSRAADRGRSAGQPRLGAAARLINASGGLHRSVEFRAPRHGSERTVTLPDRLLELLAAHIEHHADDDPAGWLFRTPTTARGQQLSV
jgi:hypothetical protein